MRFHTIRRLGQRRFGRAVVVTAVLLSGSGCRKSNDTPASPAVNDAGETSDLVARRAQKLAEMPAPPLTAPPDAVAGDLGVYRKTLAPGEGHGPDAGDSFLADVTVWDLQGKVVFSTYRVGGGASYPMSALPAALQEQVSTVRPGGAAMLWIPGPALVGWKPHGWPDDGIVLLLEILAVQKADPGKVQTQGPTAGPASSSLAPPDSADPPKSSEKAGDLRYQVFGQEASRRAGPRDQVHSLLNAWKPEGLLLTHAISDQAITISVDHAPAGLAPILLGRSAGQTARVWLPANRARQAIHVDAPVVLDILIQRFE